MSPWHHMQMGAIQIKECNVIISGNCWGYKLHYENIFSLLSPSSIIATKLKFITLFLLLKLFGKQRSIKLFCFSSGYLSYSTSSVILHLGLQTLSGSNPNQQIRSLKQAIIHPGYSSFTNDNDLCLLQLSSPVTFTNYIKPVCLAASGSIFYNGTDSWVTGWGDIKFGGGLQSNMSAIIVALNVFSNCFSFTS